MNTMVKVVENMFKSSQKYYLYDKAVDMRKSFFTLGAIVVNQMNLELLSGSSFIFINKRKTHLKMLTWEGDGFSLYYKRLEKGTFEHPEGGAGYLISHEKLILILAGIETKKIVKRRRISL